MNAAGRYRSSSHLPDQERRAHEKRQARHEMFSALRWALLGLLLLLTGGAGPPIFQIAWWLGSLTLMYAAARVVAVLLGWTT